MKRVFTVSALLALAISFSACQKEEAKITDQQEEGLILKAHYDDATKSAENQNVFSWLATDTIKVHTTAGTPAEFYLESGEGTKSAVFKTDETGITVSEVAVTPAKIYLTVYKENKIARLRLPNRYDYVANDTQAPMLAAVTEGNTSALSFKHVGGVVKITCKNIPATAGRITLWTHLRKITGDFDVSYANLGTASIEAVEAASGFGSVSIYFKNPTDEMTFYFPVPTGTYPELRFLMYDYDSETDEYTEIAGSRRIFKPTGGIEIKRGSLVNAKPMVITMTERTDWNVYYEGMQGDIHAVKTVANGTDRYVMYLLTKSEFAAEYNNNALSCFQSFAHPTASTFGITTYSRKHESFPIGTEDYVAVMIGVTDDGYFNATGDYKVVEIPKFTTSSTQYGAWLGDWTISGTNSKGEATSYTLTIAAAIPNQTFIIKGWGPSGNYTADYRFLADFDATGSGALMLRSYPIRNSNFSGFDAKAFAVVLAGSTTNNGYAYYNDKYIATLVRTSAGAAITPTTAYSDAYDVTGMGFYLKEDGTSKMPTVIRSGNNSILFATATMTKN